MLVIVAGKRPARHPPLQAAISTAVTRRPGNFGDILSRQGIMTPLTSAVVRPMMCFTGHGDSGPGTRAQDHGKDHVVTGAGAVDGLRDGKAIGVIGDPNFSLQRSA